MASETVSIDSVLEQFALLNTKDQQKFSAEMTRHLQGSVKKSKSKSKKSDSDEEKAPRPTSDAMKAWYALINTVRSALAESHGEENKAGKKVFSQAIVYNVAARFKESGDMEPSEEDVEEMYQTYLANPTPSKRQLDKASKDSGSEDGEPKKAGRPKKAAVVDAIHLPGPSAAVPAPVAAAAPKAKAAAAKAVAKPASAKAEAKPKKVAPPPVEDEEEEEAAPIETEKWVHEGKKYARNKTQPLYCWDIKTQEYMGVYDPESNSFDTSIDDPTA